MQCEKPDCKREAFATIMLGKKAEMRLCAEDVKVFCTYMTDVPGAKHVKKAAKEEIFRREF